MREPDRDYGRLQDIVQAAEHIASFTAGYSQEELANDKLRYFAVVKNVEIIGEARVPVVAALNALGADCILREGVRKCGPVITDNGNQLLDIGWKDPVDPTLMEDKINGIVGVVDNGFFTKNKPVVFTLDANGKVIER